MRPGCTHSWGSSAESPVCCVRSSLLAFPAAFSHSETASKYFLFSGIIHIDCGVDAPALKPISQTYLPVSKTFKLCFQIIKIYVFFLHKQNIHLSVEEENMIRIELVCGELCLSHVPWFSMRK